MKAPLLTLLTKGSLTRSDRSLTKFAQFLGVQTEVFALGEKTIEDTVLALPAPPPEGRILALEFTALQQFYQWDWFKGLLKESRYVLVHGFSPGMGELPALTWLTCGAYSSVFDIRENLKQFKVASNSMLEKFPVSGRTYNVESAPSAAFSGGASGGAAGTVESCLSVNEHPYFVTCARGCANFFLLAEAELVDIDMILSPEMSLRPWYAQLISLSIFLRIAFGDRCWTAPVTGATIIVDDPYLKRRYGFVNYEVLIQELVRTGGALTVAFIPYNYRRSEPETVELLRRHSNHFSIAVHGCDHTGGEFASLDPAWLEGTAACALERMKTHTRLTHMPFDNIMIFPQGKFSTQAMRALKICQYEAVVNTTPWSMDHGEINLTVRDFLEVAVTRYEKLALFIRRYPRDIFDYAFDALFQKPILAVEHHGFFRNGCGPLTDLMRKISAIGSKPVWMPLGETVSQSCVLRRTGGDTFELKQFTPVLRFRNSSGNTMHLSVVKPEQDGLVEAVTAGNQNLPFELRGGLLFYSAQVSSGDELSAKIRYIHNFRMSDRTLALRERLAISARRLLSEFRDNQLAHSTRIMSFAEKLRKKMARHKRGIIRD